MGNTIVNFDDVIDSRDVIARIEELEGEREALREEFNADPANDGVDFDNWVCNQVGWGRDDQNELRILKALADEASGYAADWQHGETLIRDSYFKDYAMELAEDCGDVKWSELRWPLTCIDWDQAARELQYDYSAVDFDGVTYWIR